MWTGPLRIAGFFASFSEEKLSFNLAPAVKYFSAAVTAQCPRHVLVVILMARMISDLFYLTVIRLVFFNCYVVVDKIRYCFYA